MGTKLTMKMKCSSDNCWYYVGKSPSKLTSCASEAFITSDFDLLMQRFLVIRKQSGIAKEATHYQLSEVETGTVVTKEIPLFHC